LADLLNVSKRTSEWCILDAYARAAYEAGEAAFFAQPTNRFSMTPHFGQDGLISTSSNDRMADSCGLRLCKQFIFLELINDLPQL